MAVTDEEVVSVPTITGDEGAKITENREIEELEKRSFDDETGIIQMKNKINLLVKFAGEVIRIRTRLRII